MPSTIVVQNLDDAGTGSLRWAIDQANASTGDVTIDFAVTGTITLETALPDLNDTTGLTEINGPGASALTVARSGEPDTPEFRIFTVDAGANVNLTGLTITGGSIAFASPADGGGIYNDGTLAVTSATISSNNALEGGGIYNVGTLTVRDSSFNGNSGGAGGGIENGGMLAITNSTFSGNVSQNGGGMLNSGTGTIVNSTFSDNRAVVGSMGFTLPQFNGGISNFGTLTLADCTFSSTSAIYPDGVSSQPNPELSPTPVTRLSIIGNIFANPAGGNLAAGPGGAFISLGHNLFSDAPAVALDPTDLINTDPLLGPLADNGGPTLTEALLPGSPAINAGVSVPGVTTDQRGVFRPQGSAPDIGAFELQMPPVVQEVQRFGVHLEPTRLVVTFSHPMDAASAEDLANYRLVSAGPDHQFGTRDDRVIRIRSVRYDTASHTITLRPTRRLPLHRSFQLTILGTPTAGLEDTAGLFLDGAGTGLPGSDYVVRIDSRLLVPPIRHHGAKRAAIAPVRGHR